MQRCVINRFWRVKCLSKLLKSNFCNKLITNLCDSLVLLFLFSWILLLCLCFNDWLILFFIACSTKNPFSFCFAVCINYFQLLFMLIILDVWLLVCLEFVFWLLSLLFFFFRGINFTLSAIVFSRSDSKYLLSSSYWSSIPQYDLLHFKQYFI